MFFGRGADPLAFPFSEDKTRMTALATPGNLRSDLFVGLTDHAEDLTSEDMREFRLECKKHSDDHVS